MTLKEAIKNVESRSRNINLNWFVCKWNDGYIIHNTTFMLKHQECLSAYNTGDLNKVWTISFDENTKNFKHVVKRVKDINKK